ncbi:hypothetical protein [Amycolatopsis sp. NBC_01480]|jgi:hypothetical protein|uniref:hypothetical protein n=1 Tax=Amycolatopsis sp. NBC_01480 TaxID=2903562 RepID=UPI002E294B82|nr:hypothetical protein [Amycolatopsis sp. NBC_01480]
MRSILGKVGLTLAAAAAIASAGVTTASAAESGPAAGARPASVLETPKECEQAHVNHDCYDYVTWFWTYDACNKDSRRTNFDRSTYDDSKCAQFSNGLNVGLYWHRP